MASSVPRFEGRVAVVTGSTAGIGLAVTRRLLAEGCKVVISSRKKDNVDKVLEQLGSEFGTSNVVGCPCHIGKKEDRATVLKLCIDAFGRLDSLILNAAVSPPQPSLLETDEALFDKVMDVNVKSCLLFAQEVADKITAPGGSITLISSIGGYAPGAPHPIYGLSKTVLFGLTAALAREFGGQGVRVNCCAPGMIKTDFSAPIWKNEEIEKAVAGRTILGRLGEADEIAGAVAFLSSQDASYMTGETMVVAGGMAASRL